MILNSAATEIQRVFKGYLTRKRLDEIYQHYANMEDSEEEENAGFREDSEERDLSERKTDVKQGKAESTVPILAVTTHQNAGLRKNTQQAQPEPKGIQRNQSQTNFFPASNLN